MKQKTIGKSIRKSKVSLEVSLSPKQQYSLQRFRELPEKEQKKILGKSRISHVAVVEGVEVEGVRVVGSKVVVVEALGDFECKTVAVKRRRSVRSFRTKPKIPRGRTRSLFTERVCGVPVKKHVISAIKTIEGYLPPGPIPDPTPEPDDSEESG